MMKMTTTMIMIRVRLLLDRVRGIIIHGPAHRGANGAAMPTDEDDQDEHFFFNHPERAGYFAAYARATSSFFSLPSQFSPRMIRELSPYLRSGL